MFNILPFSMDQVPWLESESVAVPEGLQPARFPSWLEVQQTLAKLQGFQVQSPAPNPQENWEVTIKRDGSGSEDLPETVMVFTPCPDGQTPLGCWFKTGWPPLVLAILISLAESTGPLIVLSLKEGAPALVTQSSDVQSILDSWRHTQVA